MNLFEEYKKRREQHGMRAVDAYRSVSHAAAETWRKELRQWDFNVNMIRSNMTETHGKTWVHQLPSGHVLMVLASYDYDVDQLDGLCKLEHHTYRANKDQEVVSHKDGTYWISTNDGYALVELEDGGIETGWYRKMGYAKQPAIEKAIETHMKMLEWVEDYVHGNVSYGCFEVCIMTPEGSKDDAPISSAGPLGGVEMDDEDYLLDTLNELFDEASHGLTI